MATIKAIDAPSVHKIQSGQVIVDLCSVVKELVENSLDADATSIEVRFKNHGLDSIEVQDNGSGISPSNFETVALKHYTSKLSNYDDLSRLQTFGFRGEALSSLTALSNFHITTARAGESPKGTRLDFEVSGKLKNSCIVACQKGTTVSVEALFEHLPVRRKELAKNIKREYGKAVGLLQTYACISTGVKFTVKNSIPKGKTTIVFSTQSNSTTKENIANVYDAKTLLALVPLNLNLKFEPFATTKRMPGSNLTQISVRGHISRPVYGEGRQAPDRQMFFVNGRPCGLPQIAKAINEVYKSFNVSQSPFIFADFRMDTNAYDINVSPDKRTILLHDSSALIENLKTSLAELFENQDQTVPQSRPQNAKLPAFKQLSIRHESPGHPFRHMQAKDASNGGTQSSGSGDDLEPDGGANIVAGSNRLLHQLFRDQMSARPEDPGNGNSRSAMKSDNAKESIATASAEKLKYSEGIKEFDMQEVEDTTHSSEEAPEGELENVHVRDFNDRVAEQQGKPTEQHITTANLDEPPIPSSQPTRQPSQPSPVQSAFHRMRPKRAIPEIATITVGDKTTTTILGGQAPNRVRIDCQEAPKEAPSKRRKRLMHTPKLPDLSQRFTQSVRHFAAPGTQMDTTESFGDDPDPDEEASQSQEERESTDGEYTDGGGENVDNEKGDVEKQLQDEIPADNEEPDQDYVDDATQKAQEEATVAELIRAAEEGAALPAKDNLKRATRALKGRLATDSITELLLRVDISLGLLKRQIYHVQRHLRPEREKGNQDEATQAESEEERLSLTVSKADFYAMRIVGQFNLGFILACRPASTSFDASNKGSDSDELFIIDQHASDEKFNFERLQADTVVGNQRLVRPLLLDLTAVEEEIVMENGPALEKNGFIVEVDTSGERRVGQRCKLISLPLSKEVVFDTRDLDELLHLLSESPNLGARSAAPRPSKVRKMFAMRACRSSVMVGKTLSPRQMLTVVRHMGTIDKPWNCPHGRPTMRHLMSLNAFDSWDERDERDGSGERASPGGSRAERWKGFAA